MMDSAEFEYLTAQDALLRSEVGEVRAVLLSQQQLLDAQDTALVAQQKLILTMFKEVQELRRAQPRSSRVIEGPVH
jgi:hypothetical protein